MADANSSAQPRFRQAGMVSRKNIAELSCFLACRRDEGLTPGAGHERHALEKMHVLFVLEQRAVQRRDQHLLVRAMERLGRNAFGEKQLQPIEELGGRW